MCLSADRLTNRCHVKIRNISTASNIPIFRIKLLFLGKYSVVLLEITCTFLSVSTIQSRVEVEFETVSRLNKLQRNG